MLDARHSKAAAGVLAAAALALAGAGCGGDDGSTSSTSAQTATTQTTRLTATGAAAAYAPVRAEIVALGRDIGTAVNEASSASDAQLADRFSALTVRAEAAAARLEALTVPAALSTSFDDLRQALQTGAADLRAIATAARQHDAQAAREAAQRLVSDSAGIREARAQVERQLGSGARG